MAVMTDVREAAQNLIEYAIRRSMMSARTIASGHTTPFWSASAPRVPHSTWLGAQDREDFALCTPIHSPTLTWRARLPCFPRPPLPTVLPRTRRQAATASPYTHHGRAHAEAFGCKRRVQRTHGRQRARAATDWFYGLCCDAGYVRRAAIARNIKWSTPPTGAILRSPSTCPSPRRTARYRRGRCSQEHGREVSCLPALHRNEGLSRTLRRGRRRRSSARQNLRVIPIQLDGERWGFHTARTRTLTSTALP